MEILEVPDFVVAYDREDYVELQLAPRYVAVIEAAKAFHAWKRGGRGPTRAELENRLHRTVEALEEECK